MEIQQLSPQQAAAYHELRLFSLQESPTAFGMSYEEELGRPLQQVADRLGDPANHVFGAFNQEKQLVGMATLRREQYQKGSHKASIFAVYVRPDYRGQGTGRALMDALIARARELGLWQLTLSVVTANPEALHLYENCGFEQCGLEPDAFRFQNQFYNAASMVLRLGEKEHN